VYYRLLITGEAVTDADIALFAQRAAQRAQGLPDDDVR
jgi:hypothetical protein